MLRDVLKNNLDAVFCGTAKGDTSAKRGYYYAGPGNQFYPILFKAGFTDSLLRPEDCYSIDKYGLGLTDLVSNRSGNDSALSDEDFDVPSFVAKINKYQPRFLAFNGKKSASYVLGYNGITSGVSYGLCTKTIGATRLFVLPSTSGSARSFWDESIWIEFKHLLSEKEQPVEKANMVSTPSTMPVASPSMGSIVLPDQGNSITVGDINAGQLRITVAFKSFFSAVTNECIIHYKGKTKSASYTVREGRSDVLRIGKDAMELLHVKPNSRIRISKLKNGHFELNLV